MQFKPQYTEVSFNTPEAFNAWLELTTYKEIDLADYGQDLLKIWIAETGEIIHTNLQQEFWAGRFVNLEALDKMPVLELYNNTLKKFEPYNALLIDEVTLKIASK